MCLKSEIQPSDKIFDDGHIIEIEYTEIAWLAKVLYLE